MSSNNAMAAESGIDAFVAGGRSIRGSHAVQLSEDGGVLGTAMKSLTGGKLSVSRVDVVVADGPFGPEVLIQPYAGNTPLPGEVYASVPGALIASAAYDDSGFLGFNWNSPNDELKQYLRSNKFEAYQLAEQLKHGLTTIKFSWTAQVFAVAGDRSFIVCQIGGFSGMSHGPAVAVVDALAPAIAQARADGPAATVHQTRFQSLAELAFAGELEAALAGEPVTQPDRTTLSPTDARAAVEAVMVKHASKRVLRGPVDDPKKLANITKKIAVDVAAGEICGFIDTGLRASGKAGVAFTSTGLHVNELGDHYSFEYDSITAFRLDGAEVSISGSDGTSVTIPSHGEASIIMETVAAATGRPG